MNKNILFLLTFILTLCSLVESQTGPYPTQYTYLGSENVGSNGFIYGQDFTDENQLTVCVDDKLLVYEIDSVNHFTLVNTVASVTEYANTPVAVRDTVYFMFANTGAIVEEIKRADVTLTTFPTEFLDFGSFVIYKVYMENGASKKISYASNSETKVIDHTTTTPTVLSTFTNPNNPASLSTYFGTEDLVLGYDSTNQIIIYDSSNSYSVSKSFLTSVPGTDTLLKFKVCQVGDNLIVALVDDGSGGRRIEFFDRSEAGTANINSFDLGSSPVYDDLTVLHTYTGYLLPGDDDSIRFGDFFNSLP